MKLSSQVKSNQVRSSLVRSRQVRCCQDKANINIGNNTPHHITSHHITQHTQHNTQQAGSRATDKSLGAPRRKYLLRIHVGELRRIHRGTKNKNNTRDGRTGAQLSISQPYVSDGSALVPGKGNKRAQWRSSQQSSIRGAPPLRVAALRSAAIYRSLHTHLLRLGVVVKFPELLDLARRELQQVGYVPNANAQRRAPRQPSLK